MQIEVFDTRVTTKDGVHMHFDVLVPKENRSGNAPTYAREWLKSIGINEIDILHDHCQFCHSKIANFSMEQIMVDQGYIIVQMEGCPVPIS